MKQILSGNESIAIGAFQAGVSVAAAYPGTPSTEILEALSKHKDVYTEWSTNEKVAMEVGLGACYAGVRSMVSMKHVGLNVAANPFMAASITGVVGGLVVISADDPGIHSSQDEQDNRTYAKFARVPLLEPADSQEAYELIKLAFEISEKFDTPVLFRTTTRISHSKSVVDVKDISPARKEAIFKHDIAKYVMLPVNARVRRPIVEKRIVDLTEYSENFPYNKIVPGDKELGIISSGVSYQYAREVFPKASFLKITMSYPLPAKMISKFAGQVKKLIVIEELEPFLQEQVQAMGIKVSGKEFIPGIGELNPLIVEKSVAGAGLIPAGSKKKFEAANIPARPPLLCPGCPHTGLFFTLNTLGQRSKLIGSPGKTSKDSNLVITGDIGCYTLGAYPPLYSIDTTACMGAGIGQALGMEKAGVDSKIVAVIGDSTFIHSGITGVVNGVYNSGHITIVILDNFTTAMTGHQEHPGTGISAKGVPTKAVDLEKLVRGIGVNDVKVVDAFNVKEIRVAVKDSIDNPELSVIIVKGACAVRRKTKTAPSVVDIEKCNMCGVCFWIGCAVIQKDGDKVVIDTQLCAGSACTLCQQICPKKAISPVSTGAKE